MNRRSHRRSGESGFALLLIFVLAAGIAISMMTQLPRVCFETQRDREEMLIERGEQYKRAIGLYVTKWGKYPAKIEDLENTNNIRYLRRRYIDPMTGKNEWRLVHAGPGGVLTDSLVQKGAVGPDGKPLVGPDGKPLPQGMPGSSGMNTANMGSALGMNATPGNTPSGTTPAGTTDPNQPPEVNQAVKARPSDRLIGQQPIPGQPGFDPNQQAQNAYGNPPQAPGNYQQFPQSGQPVYPGQPGYGNQTQTYPQSGYPQQAQTNPGQTPYAQPGIPGQPVQNYPMQPGQNYPAQPGQSYPMQPGQNYPVQPGQVNPMQPGQIQGQMMPGQIPGQAVPVGYAGQPGTFQPVTSPGFNQNPGFNQGQGGFNQNAAFNQNPGLNQNPAMGNPQGGGVGNQGQGGVSPAAQMIQQMLTQPRQIPGGMMAAGTGMNTAGLGPGIAGVATNFKGPAIKVYDERKKYQEWEFVYDPRKEAAKKMGAAMGGQGGTNPGNSPSQTGMSGFGQSGTQSGFGQQNPQSGFGQQNPQPGFGQQNPQSGFGR